MSHNNNSNIKRFTFLTLGLMSLGATVQATENGAPTTSFGVYDFGAGILPASTPVGTLGVRVAFYSANVQKDRHGRSMGNNFSLDVLSIGVAYFRMTDYRLLGARYGYSVAVPFFQMDTSVRVQTPGGPLDLQADPFRMADISVTPLILQWDLSPSLFVNARMQIQAPTGDYDKNRLISPGVNHWTLSPTVNTTYITDSGFEVSSSFQTDINTRNPATDYKSGVEYRHEFAVGQHAGPFTLGLGGFYYRQLSDDDAPALETGNRSRVIAAGPAISYFTPGMPAAWFHLYKEFGARNRPQGYTVALRVGHSF